MLEREDSELDTVSGTDTDTAPVTPILIKQDVSSAPHWNEPGQQCFSQFGKKWPQTRQLQWRKLTSTVLEAGSLRPGCSVEGLWWEPSCRFPDMEGCRDDTGGCSSLLISSQGCQSFHGGCSLTTSPNATDRPQAPLQHPRTEAKQNPGGGGGPGNGKLSVSHFLVCTEQNAASMTSPWVSKGRFEQLLVKEGASKKPPAAKWKWPERLIRATAVVHPLRRVQHFATPWTAACHDSLSFTISQSLLKLMPIGSVMPSNHLILCHPVLHLPAVFPSIRVFSSKSVLHIRRPKYWRFSFSIGPSKNIQGWSPLGWTGLISMLCKGLSRVFSSTTVPKFQFFSTQPSSQSNSHTRTWLQETAQLWIAGTLSAKWISTSCYTI